MSRPTFKLMIVATAVGIAASLMSFAAFLGWAPGHYLSQCRSLCPPCRWNWDLALFVCCIYPPRAGVSSAPADLQSLEDKKRVNSWPGSFKQILSELCQDCNNLMLRAVVCCHATLTRYCLLSAVLTGFPEVHEFS